MRTFAFSMNRVMRFPWAVLLFLCVSGVILGLIFRIIDAILPALVGVLIFYMFFSIKRYSFLVIGDRFIEVKLGCLVRGRILLLNVEKISIIEHKPIRGIGVRNCGGGEIAIVTITGDVVQLKMKERGYLKMFGLFPISYKKLRLSPQKRNEFIEMVKQRI